jgi:hypothetical protein
MFSLAHLIGRCANRIEEGQGRISSARINLCITNEVNKFDAPQAFNYLLD